MAFLAPLAGQIGYPDMQSMVWRVLACRPTTPYLVTSSVNMAEVLALVDPEAAAELLRSAERWSELSGSQPRLWIDYDHTSVAWALADLTRAEEVFQRELEKVKKTDPSRRNISQGGLLPMVDMLATPPSERLRKITSRYYGRSEEDD